VTEPMQFTRENYDPQRLLTQLETTIAQAKEKAAALAQVVGAGQAADGVVTVRVGPLGQLTGVDLDPKAMRLPSADLAAAVVAAAQAAQADVSAQVAELYRDQRTAYGVDFAAIAGGELNLDEQVEQRLAAAREAVRRAL
jgi:DNA-binding protein YbaB